MRKRLAQSRCTRVLPRVRHLTLPQAAALVFAARAQDARSHMPSVKALHNPVDDGTAACGPEHLHCADAEPPPVFEAFMSLVEAPGLGARCALNICWGDLDDASRALVPTPVEAYARNARSGARVRADAAL
jgi:hypothetical protein